MTLILDTRQISEADRAEAVRETIASTIVTVNIDFPEQGGPSVQGAITDLGQLRVCSVRSNALKVERTPRLARPYTLLDGEGIRQHFFSIPMSALALPYDAIRKLAAVTLSPGHPVADLAGAYFRRLGARTDIVTRPGAAAVGRPSIELVRALITTHLDAAEFAAESLESTLLLRVLEYARGHLAEPELNAAQIAVAHHVSVRHLYNVLAHGGIALGDWIRTQRLERCHEELSLPLAQGGSIGSVARRQGFSDPSSFGRLFRSAYGISPSEWREMNRRITPLSERQPRPVTGVPSPRQGRRST
jgi:AraC-like DNA-binding protein